MEIYYSKYLSKKRQNLTFLEQLRSILTQYEVLNEELGQLKTLLSQIKISQENKYDYSPSNYLVKQYQCRQKTLNTSSQFLKYINNKLSQLKRIKIKEFLKDQKKQKESLQRDKKTSSQKKKLILQINIALNQKLQRLQKPSSKIRKKRQDKSRDCEQQEKELTKRKKFNIKNKRESKLVNLPSKKGREPCHVKIKWPSHNQVEFPEGGKHLF